MSRTTLIEIQPRRPDGTVETLRLVDRSPRAAAYLGQQWLPIITELPGFEMSVGFDGQRFGALPAPQIGALSFALAPEIRAAASWVWRDAPVTIRQAPWPIDGSNPADGAFQTLWVGAGKDGSAAAGVLRVELIDRGQALRVPVAPLKFGTSGIALIDAAAAARDRAAGLPVPVAFGRCLTLPGLLVDRANNIWLFAAQPASSVQAFYDGGLAFTLGSPRANLAALQGTAPAAGNVVDWCLDASGLFLARPGDRPTYPFTADATFGATDLGSVAAAIVGGRLPFRAGVGDALSALGLGACGLYIDDEADVGQALDRLLAGLGIFWKVRADGTIDAKRLGWGSPVTSFAAHQRHAPSRLRTVLPAGRRQLGYAANNRLHGEGEIARILLADSLAYADGTPVEALKPAAAGAVPIEEAGNLIISPLQLRNFSSTEGLIRRTPPGHAGATAPFIIAHDAMATGLGYLDGPQGFAVKPGQRVTFNGRYYQTGLPNGSTLRMKAEFLNGAGAYIPGADIFFGLRTVGVNFPDNVVIAVQDSFLPPANAAAVRLSTNPNNSFSAIGYSALERPWANIHQPGADVTAANTANNTANVGGVSAAIVEGRGQLLDASTGMAVTRRLVPQIIGSGVGQVLNVNPLTATTDGGGVSTITINAHVIHDDAGTVSFSAATIAGVAASTLYYVYEDNPTYQGGARSYVATTDKTALTAAGRRYVGFITTPDIGAGPGSGGGGGGGGSWPDGKPW